MAEYTRNLKRKLGAVLVKLKKKDPGFTEEEWQIAKVLEGKGLAKFFGPDHGPKVMSIEESQKHMHLAALSYYALTGTGEEFVLRHTDDQLLDGKFLLPGENPWYDRWPWKLLLPALISFAISIATAIVTTLVVSSIKGLGSK